LNNYLRPWRLTYISMKFTLHRIVGWLFITVGVLIAACSQQIVFPGLERLLGIETIVGRDNVVYQPDGGYIFTNPGAMMRWIASVAAVGVFLAVIGAFMLYRARYYHRSSDARAAVHTA
jgi:hypothetical protein